MKKIATENQQENLNGKPIDSRSKIDAIKDLIFGENIQAYNSEFESVKADILSKKKELESLMDDIKSELLQNMDSLNTDLNIRITDLEDSLSDKLDKLETLDDNKTDRKLLSDLFINLGKKISE